MSHDPGASGEGSAPLAEVTESAPLSGWRLRLAWAGLALLVAWGVALNVRAVPTYMAVYDWAEPAFQTLHITAWHEPGAPVVPQVGGVAEQAGMPEGRLVAVEGKPVAETASFMEAAALVRAVPGDAVRLSVATEAGDTVTVAVPRTDALSPEYAASGKGEAAQALITHGIEGILLLVFVIAALVLGLRLRRRGVALLGVALFAVVGIETPIILVAANALDTGQAGGGLVVSDTLSLFDSVLFGHAEKVLFLTFLMVFPDGRVRPRWVWATPLLFVGGMGWLAVSVRSG